MSGHKLTPEQLKAWREIFPKVFGHSSDGFSDEQVQAMRDRMQIQLDEAPDDPEPAEKNVLTES